MLGGVSITIYVRLVNRHKILRMRQRLKSKLCIKSVSILRGQQKPPQSLQLWMLKNGTHEQLRYTTTAMLRHDKNIRNIGDGCKIRNNSGKANLPLIKKRSKAKRMLNRTLDDSSRNALCPI